MHRVGVLDHRAFDLVVAKTVTLAGRRGNLRAWAPWRSVRLFRGGVVNAVGLTNPGFDWWRHSALPRGLEAGVPLAPSLWGTAEEVGEMARRLNDVAERLPAVELNASCPNTTEHGAEDDEGRAAVVLAQAAAVAGGLPGLPLIVKLGAGMPLERIASGLRTLPGGVAAVSVNSVPWAVYAAESRSPLDRLGGGGVSGPPARSITWQVARLLAGTGVPVLWPSVTDAASLQAAAEAGAEAVSLGSVFLRAPWRAPALARLARG